MAAVHSARRILGAALSLLLLCATSTAAGAQQIQGRVLLQGSGVGGVPVELHRVTRDAAGVIGTTTSSAEGSFAIALPPADTLGFTVYFATTEYQGVRYFGAPLHPNEPQTDYTIAVYDTVSVAAAQAPVRVARRDLVLIPDPAGGWEVNEIVQLLNPGVQTLVARQAMPTWEFRVPAGAEGLEVGEGEMDARELVRMQDRVLLTAPIVPGSREIFVRYRIPPRPGEFGIPLDTPTDSLNVFVRQPSPTLTTNGLRAGESIQADGSEFQRYAAADLGTGAVITVAWRSGGAPIDPTIAAMAVLGALLLLGAVAAVWRRPRRGAGEPPARVIPVNAVVREPVSSESAV